MRIRPSVLVAVSCTALFSLACAQPEMESGQEGQQAMGKDTGQELALWQPMTVDDCQSVSDFLARTDVSFDSVPDGPVQVTLQLAGDRLQASPGPIAVSPGQTVQWQSDLEWTLRFVADSTPLAPAGADQTDERPVRLHGEGDGELGYGVEAQIAEDARCGIYHYVVAAADADGNLYVLDPPMVVKD